MNKSNKTPEAEITLKIKTPQIPNYVRVLMPDERLDEGSMVSIGDLTDDQLESLAEDWKKKLLTVAKHKRKFKESHKNK